MIENRIVMLSTEDILPRSEGTRLRSQVDWDWVAELGEAIAVQGLLVPIITDKHNKILAGEHRLEAFKRNARLGIICNFPGYKNWTVIPVRKADGSEFNSDLIELIENLLRKKMDWKEEAAGIYKLMEYQPQGEEEINEDYSQRLAELTGISAYKVGRYLALQNSFSNARIQAADSLQEALNVDSRLRKRALDSLTDDLSGLMLDTEEDSEEPVLSPETVQNQPKEAPPKIQTPVEIPAPNMPANVSIHNQDFIQWADQYSGAPFNFIHCDFPYGVNMDKSSMTNAASWNTYSDSPDIYFALVNALIQNKSKLFGANSFLMFWYSEKFGEVTRKMFKDAGFKRWTHPLIWHKSCNSGVLPDYRRYPRHTYENAMVFTLGDPFLVQPVADSWSGPATKESGHVSEKPVPMLSHFFRMFVDEHTRMLDPTAGSFTSLSTALDAGAKSVTGVELDPEHFKAGQIKLKTQEIDNDSI